MRFQSVLTLYTPFIIQPYASNIFSIPQNLVLIKRSLFFFFLKPASRKLRVQPSSSYCVILTYLFYTLSCVTPGSYRICLVVSYILICLWNANHWGTLHTNNSILQSALSISRRKKDLATRINLSVPLKSKSFAGGLLMQATCKERASVCLSTTQTSGQELEDHHQWGESTGVPFFPAIQTTAE